ncbi:MAG: polysaccharide ABC transporter ATP-binding protein [Thermodesulfovibrionales bacterium]
MPTQVNAICVNALTKTYRIYKGPLQRLKGLLFDIPPSEVFTALRDVTLSVKKGETVGIIGENGAGKSTLLKIISGVLTPSSGDVEVKGAVLSILELGTGFHPEFTGRENIFFYGDVLGFERGFVRGRLDEIISFSELGTFIDKPVKTYSSGMFMRLAFSIVTAFEPDILILDEVLAVGDIHFQRKSLKRVLDIKRRGGTILFCSHDTYHIRMICDRAIWLKDGAVYTQGEAEGVVLAYEGYQFSKGDKVVYDDKVTDDLPVMIKDIRIDTDADRLTTGGTMRFFISTLAKDKNMAYHLTLSIKLPDGRGVYVTGTHLMGMAHLKGCREIAITFTDIALLAGTYYAHVRVFDETGLICIHERPTQFFTIHKERQDFGICLLKHNWLIN